MASFRRVILIVIDSVGVGETPDAAAYGDAGSDTLGNLSRARPFDLPNLVELGLASIRPVAGLEPAAAPLGAYGKCAPASPGKDTTTGHWEMAGIHLARPFRSTRRGFPREIMDEFERRIGRGSLATSPPRAPRSSSGSAWSTCARGADRLHFGRQRVSGGGARGDHPGRGACTGSAKRLARSSTVRTRWGASSRGRSSASPAPSCAPPTARTSPCRRPRACCSIGWLRGTSPSTAWARSTRSSWDAAYVPTPRPRATPTAWRRCWRPWTWRRTA